MKIINTIQSSLEITEFSYKSDQGKQCNNMWKEGHRILGDVNLPMQTQTQNTKMSVIITVALLPNNLLAAAGRSNGIIYIMKNNGYLSQELRLAGEKSPTSIKCCEGEQRILGRR